MYAGSIIRKLAINSNFKKLQVIGQVEWIKRQKKKSLLFSSIFEKKNPWNIPSSLDNADENESSLWKARSEREKEFRFEISRFEVEELIYVINKLSTCLLFCRR